MSTNKTLTSVIPSNSDEPLNKETKNRIWNKLNLKDKAFKPWNCKSN